MNILKKAQQKDKIKRGQRLEPVVLATSFKKKKNQISIFIAFSLNVVVLKAGLKTTSGFVLFSKVLGSVIFFLLNGYKSRPFFIQIIIKIIFIEFFVVISLFVWFLETMFIPNLNDYKTSNKCIYWWNVQE